MKTAVTDTSIDAFHALSVEFFSGKHADILSHMDAGRKYTRRELAWLTGMETSSASGRVNELLHSEPQVIVIDGRIKCPHSGRVVEAVRLAGTVAVVA